MSKKAKRVSTLKGRVKNTTGESGINRLSASVNHRASKILSNLRFSLTLRIALHYVGQLLRTTLLVLTIVTVVYAVAQQPTIHSAFAALEEMQPGQDGAFAEEQLARLPLRAAYYLDAPYPNDTGGWIARVKLALSDMRLSTHPQISLYETTATGGLVAVFDLQYVVYVYSMLVCTLLCCDLLRVWSFLRRRNRLNKKVLRPIEDMTAAAAALSASNLSDRINIAGTKNELKDLATVINGMLDRIELSYNSQKQFVSDASHELRTPIAVIQGYASMLERWGKTDKEVLDEGITAISQETASMKELVERLLFLARHDKKTLMLEMEDFDPAEVLSAVHRDAKLLSPAHEFELTELQPATVRGDKSMIKQLLRILIDNATKYTPAGGRILLSQRNDGVNAILTVTDTGNGISAEELPRIFDRFYRSDEARKSQASGHGLGLSIARIIVVAHGGHMKVRSKLGAGTTFSVLLPLSREELPPAEEETEV